MDWNGDADCRPLATRSYVELPAKFVDSLSHPPNAQAFVRRDAAAGLHSCREGPNAVVFHWKPDVSVVSCEANRS